MRNNPVRHATCRLGSGLLTRFCADRSGAIALIFALTIGLMMAAVGGAVDFARAYRAQTLIQNGMDAAALAAARVKQTGGSDAEATATGEAYMRALVRQFALTGEAKFTVLDAGTAIQGDADYKFGVSFLRVMGFDQLSLRTASVATFGIGSASSTNVELVMMLDVTGSMRGQKIEDLKLAADDLISIVIPDATGNGGAKIGLAPFAEAVKLDNNTFRAATGKDNSGPGSYKGCVVERTGPAAFTDELPGPGAYLVPLEDAGGSSCMDGREAFPLSNKKSDLKAMVRTLEPGGRTAGHLGTAWAWYLLSPNWASAFDGNSRPLPYEYIKETTTAGDPKLRKIAVLMTDGEYNIQYSATDSTTQARRLCDEMKKQGIEVFTVGFDLGGNATAIETLRGCASQPSMFYNTTTGEQLRMAFRDIALQAAPLRLSR